MGFGAGAQGRRADARDSRRRDHSADPLFLFPARLSRISGAGAASRHDRAAMSATRREALGLLAATGLAATTAAEAAEAALAGAQGAATSDWRPLFNGRNL